MADTKEEVLSPTETPQTPKSTVASSDSDDNVSGVNEKALLRKLDAHLLPAVGLLYLLSFLDRSNGRKPTQKAHVGSGARYLTA
ncbi:hypothetical protein IMZ48_42650 [Candidatus Bathyarchaeota archaeon]|nr:hypothetical protein [Candidatus Bathyarchaeota archaeon]